MRLPNFKGNSDLEKLDTKERIAASFHSKYIPEPMSGCWIWERCVNNTNYGVMRVGNAKNGKIFLASRISFYLRNGFLPKDKLVCHFCDNPYCVNPEHLFLGSHKDNIMDMISKSRHPTAGRIALSDYGEIRAARLVKGASAAIARRLGVSPAAIHYVQRGRRGKLTS